MKAGNEHVHVERKTTVGSLNEVALGHPFDFASQEFLLFITPQVFNQGVAEDNIKRVIGERQSGGIGGSVYTASTRKSNFGKRGNRGMYIPDRTAVRAGK